MAFRQQAGNESLLPAFLAGQFSETTLRSNKTERGLHNGWHAWRRCGVDSRGRWDEAVDAAGGPPALWQRNAGERRFQGRGRGPGPTAQRITSPRLNIGRGEPAPETRSSAILGPKSLSGRGLIESSRQPNAILIPGSSTTHPSSPYSGPMVVDDKRHNTWQQRRFAWRP